MEEERIFNPSKEEWRDVVGYEGFYQVSNYGRIKVLPHLVSRGFCTITCAEKILKPRVKNNQYLFVRLSSGHKKTSKEKYVHRIVADAFLPNPNNKPEIDHIDGDKTNNFVANLRWSTRMENVHNPNTIGKCRKRVIIISKDGEYENIFPSLTIASKELHIPLSTLSWAKNNSTNFRYIIKDFKTDNNHA